jgi:hypothetical protein
LLPTLIASPLDAGLALLLPVGVIVVMVMVDKTAWATFNAIEAGASLALEGRPRVNGTGRAH